MTTKDDILQVTESFVGNLKGREVEYHRGELVSASDPAVKKWPAHFGEPVIRPVREVPPTPEVEQASAAPGEKRG